MRSFTCENCGQLLFFENSLCLRCSSPLGFEPSEGRLAVLGPPGTPESELPRCANATIAACNWVPAPLAGAGLCASCERTRTRPNDADLDADGLLAFAKAEAAKRRLLFELEDLGLPIGSDLRFDLLSSRSGPVMTVVTTAMTTSIVKTFCGMKPRSKPMFSTISSISARVFMSTPRMVDSRAANPVTRAAK